MSYLFYDLFHPEEKLKNKRLSGNSPCVDCPNVHRFTRGTAWLSKLIDKEKCNICAKKIMYDSNCMAKLQRK